MNLSLQNPVRYRFKFSPLLIAVTVLVFALCAFSIGYTSLHFAEFIRGGDFSNFYEWLKYLIPYLVSALFLLLAVAILIRSQYVVTDDALIMQFGFIKQRFEIGKIVSVHQFKGAGKLAVYFDDRKTDYILIVIKDALFNDFVRDLCSRDERIQFTFSTADEEEEAKKKK